MDSFLKGLASPLRRILSCLTTLVFLISSLEVPPVEAQVSAGAVRMGSAIIQEIKISPKWGDILSRFEGESKELVIQIQDAHCNFEAQSNTARILEELFKKHGDELKIVNVEGSSGKIDTSALTLFPDREIKKQLGLYYLRKGKISGAEYLSIIKDEPLKIEGVEDLELYFQNLKWFDHSLEFRAKADRIIGSLENTLKKLQKEVFNDDLKRLLKSQEGYEKGKATLIEHLSILKELSEKKEVKIQDLQNVSLFIKTEEDSQRINFEDVEKERTAVVDQLLPMLSKEESAEFLTLNLYFRLEKIGAHEYFNSLGKLITDKKIEKESYTNLTGYIQYLEHFNQIDRSKFSEELEIWAKRMKEKLLQTEEERELAQRMEEIRFLRNFYHLELTREDLKFYEERKGEIRGKAIREFLLKICKKYGVKTPNLTEINFLEENLSSLEKFYEVAVKRDEVLTAKTMEGIEKSKAKIGVLIAGGFHTEGIREKLREKGISYVVVSPRITNIEARSPYISVMQDKRTPMEEVLKKELMGQEITRRTSSEFLGNGIYQTMSPMSPLQEEQLLLNLISQGRVDVAAVRRKMETAQLFTLMAPSLLKILVSASNRPDLQGILKEWKTRIDRQITGEARRVWPEIDTLAVNVGNINQIGDQFFIDLTINQTPYGIIVDQDILQNMKVAGFVRGLLNGNQFEVARSNAQKVKEPILIAKADVKKPAPERVVQAMPLQTSPRRGPPPKAGAAQRKPGEVLVRRDLVKTLLPSLGPTAIPEAPQPTDIVEDIEPEEEEQTQPNARTVASAAKPAVPPPPPRQASPVPAAAKPSLPPPPVPTVAKPSLPPPLVRQTPAVQQQAPPPLPARQAPPVTAKPSAQLPPLRQPPSVPIRQAPAAPVVPQAPVAPQGVGTAAIQPNVGLPSTAQPKSRNLILAGAIGIVVFAGALFGAYRLGASDSSTAPAPTLSTVPTIPGSVPAVNVPSSTAPVTPNVLDVIRFNGTAPITEVNQFSWDRISSAHAGFNVRIETSPTNTFTDRSAVAVYTPEHNVTSVRLERSVGHRFLQLTLVTNDASASVVGTPSTPISITVPIIPAVENFSQAEEGNRLTWSLLPGVSAYRVWVRRSGGVWREVGTVEQGILQIDFPVDSTRARIRAVYRDGTRESLGESLEIDLRAPAVAPPVPTERPIRRPSRPPRPAPTSGSFFAPIRISKAEGIERAVDFGRLTGTTFSFNDPAQLEVSLTDESRLNYQEKIEEALAFLGRYQDLSDVNLPVTVVEDLNTLADFGHEQDLLRIDTDLLSEKYDSPAMRALYFRHEIHHSRGANEIEAVQGDLAFYGELMKSGERIPEALLKEDPYLSFLNQHHTLSSQEQESAIQNYLRRLEFSRSIWRAIGKVQGFFRQSLESMGRLFQPLRDGWGWLRSNIRPLRFLRNASLSFLLAVSRATRPILAVSLGSAAVVLAAPQVAQAQDGFTLIEDGYKMNLRRPTSDIPEGSVLAIRTCGATSCSAAAGREDYYVEHGAADQYIWLTRSRGHRFFRHAIIPVTGRDGEGRPTLGTATWSSSNPLPDTLSVPQTPAAPGNFAFNASTRRLTWDAVTDVRAYEVTALNASGSWISLGAVSASDARTVTITQAGLTRVRVVAVRGVTGGEIRSTATEIPLESYTLAPPVRPDEEVPTAILPTAPAAEVGSIVRMPSGSYVLSLTPVTGTVEYHVYTSTSAGALRELREYFDTNDESHRTRARALGYEEYTSTSPDNIALTRSTGHNYYLVTTTRARGASARQAPSEVVTMGSRSLPTSDFYFRGTLGWSAAWPLASDPSTVGEFSLRELTAGAFLTPETPGAGPLRLEGSYRSTPLINQVTSDGQRYRLDYGTITLGSRFGVHLPDFTFRIDPQLGAMIMYKEDVGFYSRMPFELSGIIRPNAHHSFRLGVWGEGRFIALPERQDVLPWDFNTRSGEFIPGSHTRYFDMRRAGLYSGVTARPGVTWSYEDAGHRFSLGAAYEIEIAHPLSHTILGTLEYDYSNLFRITGQGGYYFSNYLPVDETTGVRAAPFVRGRIFARPSPVVEIGASAGFQWGDRELNVSGLDLRFPIPRAEGVTIVAQPLQFYRNELFFGNVTAYSGTIGLEINPNAWFERAPIITGKEPGEVATADRGYLSGGRFNFDETWTEMSGIGEEGRRVYGERLNEALGFLGRYRDLGDVKLSTEIVEDLNTWMDFGHDVDEGPASGFGMERSLLRIDTDALGEKYSKEAVALMLDHELAHARGADEQGAILSNLGLYRRWKQERPGFLFPDALRGEHPFFQFLEEHYNDPIEDQVDAIRLFLYENGFDRDRNITMRMTREEAVEYGRRIQSQTELRQALERVRGFKEGLRREELIGLIQQGITELLGEDIIEDNRGLKQRLERVTRGLARSNLSIDEVMKEVEGIVGVRMETPEEEAVKGPEGRNRIQAVAVAILLVANFLRGGKVAPKVLEGMVKAHLEGKTYEGRALNQMTLDDVVALYGEKRAVEGLTDTELEALENTVGLGKVVKYFNVVGDLKEGNITNAIKTLNELERRADAERDFRDLANQTEAKLITVNSDGALEIAGNFIQTTDTLREQLRALNETVSQRRGRQGPVYIDLTGGGYLHPDRLNKVMESILENPEKAVEGLEIENFIGFDEKGKWGYNDGAKVQVQLVEDVIQVKVQSLSERYEEMMGRVQARMIGKIRNMKKAQVLISTGKTFGIDIEKNKEGQIVVKAQSQDFKRFYTPILEILRSGQNMLKLAIPVVLPKGISRDEVSDELILRALFGEEEYAKLRERLDQEIYVEFYEEGHPAVQTQKLGGQVKQDVAENFRNKGVALDTANPMTFIVSEKEQELYQDLEQALLWIIEGNLDTKKLMLIAEQLTSNGIKDQELLEFLKKADPEAIEEMNRHKLSTPKTMMEEFGLRIKTQRQTATMA